MAKKLPGLKRHTIGARAAEAPPARSDEAAAVEAAAVEAAAVEAAAVEPVGSDAEPVVPDAEPAEAVDEPVEPAAEEAEVGAEAGVEAAEAAAEPVIERSVDDDASAAGSAGAIAASVAERREAAMQIVERHGRFALVGGALPLPLVDMAAVAAIQVRMLLGLAGHYEVPLSKHRAEAIVMPLMGSVTPHALGGAARWLVGPALPVVGWLAGMAGGGLSAHAITRVIGGLFVDHFERVGRAPGAGELDRALLREG